MVMCYVSEPLVSAIIIIIINRGNVHYVISIF